MAIRNAQESDFEKLVVLYKSFFPNHNIFSGDSSAIVDYLKLQFATNELFISENNGEVDGALFIVKKGESADGTHKIWKFRHFAFKSEDVFNQLLIRAEKGVGQLAQTGKIELTLAEDEKGIDLYKKKGYDEEGKLKNHYRWGETCLLLGKSLS